MPFLLHLETATEVCSVALSENDVLRVEKTTDKPFQHTAQLTPMVEQVLNEAAITPADLAAVSFSKGPGSYTALRAGLSTAKGICYALDIPLISIDTLQSIAVASFLPDDGKHYLYIPMIDARRMEVYAAVYDGEGEEKKAVEATLLNPDSFREHRNNDESVLVFSGNGSFKFREITNHPAFRFRSVRCRAAHLIPLAWKSFCQQEFVDIAYYAPSYFKAPHITTPKKGNPLLKNTTRE